MWESQTCGSEGGSPQTLRTSTSARNHGDRAGEGQRVLGRIGERIGLAALGRSWAQQGLIRSHHSRGQQRHLPPSPGDARASIVCSESRSPANRSRRCVSRGRDSPARLGPQDTRRPPATPWPGLVLSSPQPSDGRGAGAPGNAGRPRVGSGCCSARFQSKLGWHEGCHLWPRTPHVTLSWTWVPGFPTSLRPLPAPGARGRQAGV